MTEHLEQRLLRLAEVATVSLCENALHFHWHIRDASGLREPVLDPTTLSRLARVVDAARKLDEELKCHPCEDDEVIVAIKEALRALDALDAPEGGTE